MDTADFLARVLADGSYINISYNYGTGTPISRARMFRRDQLGKAAGYAKFMARLGNDVFHSQATFINATEVTPQGKETHLEGERKAHNAENLKTFWIDLDVKRPGDKKDLAKCFATQHDAALWLRSFVSNVGLPDASIVVNSGYGLHVYWILEDQMPSADWLPYGRAFAEALRQNGLPEGWGYSSDNVRLLRPPGTFNQKSGSPVDVTVRKARNDVPNKTMLDALQPFMGLGHVPNAPNAAAGQRAANNASVLAGGSNVVAFRGAAVPNMNAMVAATTPATMQPRFFREMAAPGGCEQVRQSLAEGGKNDNRHLWYLGMLTAAVFCTDGVDYIHPIGDQHPAYTHASTESEYARAIVEKAQKNVGFPSCSKFHAERPATCVGCKHWNVIKSPLDIATLKGAMPVGFRCQNGLVQLLKKNDNGAYWETIFEGEISDPRLDKIASGHGLSFKYTLHGKEHPIFIEMTNLKLDTLYPMLARQHLDVPHGKEVDTRKLMQSLSQQLRAASQIRHEHIEPFGWITKGAEHTGFAVAGTLYRPDGSEEPAPGGDTELVEHYRVQGDFTQWQKAATFVLDKRPDLQVVVAASFAAPLVGLTGNKGLILSAWSTASGVGKTSALDLAQGVWGSFKATMSLKDTENSAGYKLGQIHSLPAFWDEMQGSVDTAEQFVQFIFQVTQGKEKSRLNANSELRKSAEWETMLTACANSPLMDRVIRATQGTEAGALRVFEFKIDHPPMAQDARASRITRAPRQHYGHAGREYARYISAKHADILKMLDIETNTIGIATGATQAERFHVATMTTLLIGAKIARHLGFYDFDISAIRRHLYETLDRLRVHRSYSVLANNKGYDVEQIFSQFMSLHQSHRVITKSFVSGNVKATVIDIPEDRKLCSIHISQTDAIIRIERDTLVRYLEKSGLSPSDFIEKLKLSLGATEDRSVLGGGTRWATGRLKVLNVPIVGPDMEASYLFDTGETPTQRSTANALKRPD
jgi:hypothetical protein